jgi:anti-sigma B factor antagonist
MALQTETRRVEPDIVVVQFSGRITLGPGSGIIEPLVYDLLHQNEKKVIFDLTGVKHIDSTGILTITHCFFTLRAAGGGLRLAGASERVARLFKITRLDTLLPFYPTVAAACEGFVITPRPQQ